MAGKAMGLLLLCVLPACTPMPTDTREAIADWRSGKPDEHCEIPGSSVQWQADYCLAAMQTDDITAAHLLAIVEAQMLAQRQRPAFTILLDGVAHDHLQLRVERLIEAIKRVENQEAMIARGAPPARDRVKNDQV